MLSRRLVLASLSPRRRELLLKLLEPFEVLGSSFREEEAEVFGSPREIAEEFAKQKALGVAVMDEVVLAADTVIDCRGEFMGKPADREEAFRMLRILSGSTHRVVTGLAVLDRKRDLQCVTSVSTEVRMRSSSDAELWDYVDTLEPMDKAGAYAIQGHGRVLVENVRGCYTNVVGLPLCEVVRLLDGSGVRLRDSSRFACQDPVGRLCPRVTHEKTSGA